MTLNKSSNNGWNEYRRLVIAELERLGIITSKLIDTNLEHEREFSQLMTELKEEFTERLHNLKHLILEDTESKIDQLSTRVQRNTEKIKIIEAKSALFGFIAGLIIAVAGVLVNFWIKP